MNFVHPLPLSSSFRLSEFSCREVTQDLAVNSSPHLAFDSTARSTSHVAMETTSRAPDAGASADGGRAPVRLNSVAREAITSQLTDEQIAEFKEAFALFDRDGSGSITIRELESIMRSLGQNPTERELKDMIEGIDIDGNGEIDFPEFMAMMAEKIQDTNSEQEIIAAFQTFDRDSNNYLSRDELQDVLTRFGDNSMSEADVREMIAVADKNGDGKIQYEEFAHFISSVIR